jgi:hypothetical protein
MPRDFIPVSKAEFGDFLKNLAAKLDAAKGSLNIPAASVTSLSAVQVSYQQALEDEETARIDFEAKREATNTLREQAEAEARAMVRMVQADPGTTDAFRAELQIPIRDTTRTASAPIKSRPIITIDFSQRQQHDLDFRDSETPTRRARPDNTTGCEFRSFVGTTPPTGLSQFKYLDTDAKTPLLVQYGDEDAGKTAYYIARWVNNEEKGPWSETVSATIAG